MRWGRGFANCVAVAVGRQRKVLLEKQRNEEKHFRETKKSFFRNNEKYSEGFRKDQEESRAGICKVGDAKSTQNIVMSNLTDDPKNTG